MAKVKKICRICGKTYTPCSYCENDQMAWHYRTICCSAECARVYMARVLEAREQNKNETKEETNAENNSVEPSEQIETSEQKAVIKPKRKYVRKKKVDEKDKEQIE